MANAVSTFGPARYPRERRGPGWPPPQSFRAECSAPCVRDGSALRARHSGLDPLFRSLVGGRVHALRRIADDVDHFGRLLLLVVAIGAVGGVMDALVAPTERHLHAAGGAVVLDALEGLGDFVGRRLAAALGRLRLLP